MATLASSATRARDPLSDHLIGVWVIRVTRVQVPSTDADQPPKPTCPCVHPYHDEIGLIVPHILPYSLSQRKATVDRVESLIRSLGLPVLVMGDFNARPAAASPSLNTPENTPTTADEKNYWRYLQDFQVSNNLHLLSGYMTGDVVTHDPSKRTLDLIWISTCCMQWCTGIHVVPCPMVARAPPLNPQRLSDHNMVVLQTSWPLPSWEDRHLEARKERRTSFWDIVGLEPQYSVRALSLPRRINEADRLVYEVFDDRVEFLQARYHY